MVTNPDRLERELDIIYSLFTAQYLKRDSDSILDYPVLLDWTGSCRIDGRYINYFDIYSNVELFNLQMYKKDFTERFEKANNRSLLLTQLIELKNKANLIRDYYNENLTNKNSIVSHFLERRCQLTADGEFERQVSFVRHHSAIVTVSNYYIGEIYIGAERGDKLVSDYIYSYGATSYKLAVICQQTIEFIEEVGVKNGVKTSKKKPKAELLLDIWMKDKKHYNEVIDFLKESSAYTGCPFVNENIKWMHFQGNKTSLVAFAKCCINKQYIAPNYSAPQLQKIFCKTFGIDISEKLFQRIVFDDFPKYRHLFVMMP